MTHETIVRQCGEIICKDSDWGTKKNATGRKRLLQSLFREEMDACWNWPWGYNFYMTHREKWSDGELPESPPAAREETVEEWFARIDAIKGDPLFPEGRKLNLAPVREYPLDERPSKEDPTLCPRSMIRSSPTVMCRST